MQSVPIEIDYIIPPERLVPHLVEDLPWGLQWEIARLIQSAPAFLPGLLQRIKKRELQEVQSTEDGMKQLESMVESVSEKSQVALRPLVTSQERRLKVSILNVNFILLIYAI
jgi:hypothetical protein